MKIVKNYYDGDLNRGGFRYLANGMICIDIREENKPYETYLNDLIKYVNQNAIKRFFINTIIFTERIDLSFLYDIKSVEEISISALCIDLEPLYAAKPKTLHLQNQGYSLDVKRFEDSLVNLEIYNLNSSKFETAQLDENLLLCKKIKTLGMAYFNNFDCKIIKQLTWLDELKLSYSKDKKFSISIIGDMKGLKRLFMQQVPVESFYGLNYLAELKKMTLTQVQLSSFQGIGNLTNLEELAINYCSKLTDISQIKNCTKLKKLEIQASKKIESFEEISELKELKGLVISNCGEIPSLKFINDLPELKFLSFVDTNIVDGDLTPCMRLEYVGTSDKKHYNIKSKDLPNNRDYAFGKL